MNFNGRWVPMEVMNTVFLFWAIGVLLIGAVLLWLWRSERAKKERQQERPHAQQEPKARRRARRKKR